MESILISPIALLSMEIIDADNSKQHNSTIQFPQLSAPRTKLTRM